MEKLKQTVTKKNEKMEMKKMPKKNKGSIRNRSEEDFSDEDYDFYDDEVRSRKKKDVGKRAHRKRTQKDDFWDEY